MNAILLASEAGAFNWHDLIVQLLGFLILALVLWKLVFPTVGKMLGDRSRGIEEHFAKLDRELAETAEKVTEYGKRLAEIERETKKRLQAAQEEGEAARSALMAEARAQAQAEFDKARREVQMESDKAVLELRGAVTEMTVAATEKVIDAVMDAPLHGKLVEKYIGNLEKVMRQK